ncbi:hypothetical protein CH63R_14454 [Colletotrichum higginsianum IMI 349063]|uniref:Uncharacterized protein n=1 Tax=Colletotrichum higginsianum (strain IMI 349063) TaxID=759273 RepID=A0A1B7XQW7_COLHI|nr:hypothetical protein CH63R_14454 [Colletotrichum higginsianum IMI 349063]OBR02153.1 hypothetical protein CH63R_14454 [Colletotrichum higginsianum IMI 349063]
MAEPAVDDSVRSDADGEHDCPFLYSEVDHRRFTPEKPYCFALQGSVDELTWAGVLDDPLSAQQAHLQSVREAGSWYKPAVFVIAEYNTEFVLVAQDYLRRLELPSSAKVRLWWPADDGNTLFRAHLLRQFKSGKTRLDAIMQTAGGYDLETHLRWLPGCDRETANLIYLASPRAILECRTLRDRLSKEAKAVLAQEDEDRAALARLRRPKVVADKPSKFWWEGLEHGF